MQLHVLSNKVFASPSTFESSGRQRKQAVLVKPVQLPRLHRIRQWTAAAQASEQIVNRVPATSVEQQVQFCKL